MVEVTTRDKHAEEWTRRIQTDVYAGSVFAAGPVGKKDMLWMSFRRSWIDAVLPLVSDVLPLDFTVAPRFYDYFLKWDRKLTGTGRLGFVYQGALDKVKFAIEQPPDFDPSVRGDISTLTMFHRIRPYASFRVGDWRHKSSINIQLESFDVNLAQAFKLTVETYRKSWRHEAQRKLSESMDWVVGVDHQQTTYDVFGKASGRPQEGSGPGSFAHRDYRVRLAWCVLSTGRLQRASAQAGVVGEPARVSGRHRRRQLGGLSPAAFPDQALPQG